MQRVFFFNKRVAKTSFAVYVLRKLPHRGGLQKELRNAIVALKGLAKRVFLHNRGLRQGRSHKMYNAIIITTGVAPKHVFWLFL
eukprot:2205507-Amphidinium_carterae.1